MRRGQQTPTLSPARAIFALVSAGAFWLAAGAGADAATVRLACEAEGLASRLCREGARAWAASTGHIVESVPTPRTPDVRLAHLQKGLAAGRADFDVLEIDVVWVGILGHHLLDLSPYFGDKEIAAHFSTMIENNTVYGALRAIPWYADTGILYYRKDLLRKHGYAVPETWTELARAANAIVRAERAAGDDRLVGFVFEGRAGEGLVACALEWITSFGGGGILGSDGAVDLINPGAVEALATAASWVGVAAPTAVLGYGEEDARKAFQAGGAVFMRNWVSAWVPLNKADSPVRGTVGIARVPRTDLGGHASALGGGALAIAKDSPKPWLAVDLVRYLTGWKEQARRALAGPLNPTRPTIYRYPPLVRTRPVMASLLPVLEQAIPSPARIAGAKYGSMSAILSAAFQDALSGRHDVLRSLSVAHWRIEKLSRGGHW